MLLASLAHNPDPTDPAAVVAINESLAGLGHQLHGAGGNLLILAIILHVAGAIKHEAVDKDGLAQAEIPALKTSVGPNQNSVKISF